MVFRAARQHSTAIDGGAPGRCPLPFVRRHCSDGGCRRHAAIGRARARLARQLTVSRSGKSSDRRNAFPKMMISSSMVIIDFITAKRDALLEVARHPHMPERGEMRQPNLGEAFVRSNHQNSERRCLNQIAITHIRARAVHARQLEAAAACYARCAA
eukprot:352480-Chlamydomonas_euryale.AAC.1